MKTYAQGFSLVELMVVICLLGGFAAISMPAMSGTLKRSEAKITASKIANWISALRQKSINEQIEILIELKENTFTASAKQNLKVKKFRTTTRIVPSSLSASLSVNSVTLHTTGTQSPATIRLKSNAAMCIIRLALRGRITTECE